jgi:L-fucose mutarotase
VYPGVTTIYLNLRPGLLTAHQVLEPLLHAVPVEAADVMTPGDGTEPDVFAVYRELLGPAVPLRSLERFEFYAACREPDLAVCVATGDDRLYANILLTVGFIPHDENAGAQPAETDRLIGCISLVQVNRFL